MVKPLGFGKTTENDYVRLIVDALQREQKTGKEFRFADS
jgi:hypothetical protein